jgi:PAS domain S-box-containing protein
MPHPDEARLNPTGVPDAILGTALDALADAVMLVRMSDGVIRWVNRSFETLFGYPAAAAVERTSGELGLWVDPGERERALELLRCQGRVRRFGAKGRRRSGEEFDCEYSSEAVNVGGEAHAVVIIRDVSDRTRSERALRRSEEKFERLFRDGPLAMSFVRVADNALMDVNGAWERQFGYSRAEALGRSASELDLWVNRKICEDVIAKIVECGSVGGLECELKNRSGRRFSAAIDASRIEIAGEPYFMFVVRDLSSEKAAQAEARERGERIDTLNHMLRLVIDTIPVRVFWKNTDSRYLGCNALFARDAGRSSPDELVGRTDQDMTWRPQADLYRADDAAVMASGESKIGYEEPQSTPDGRTIWLRTSKVPMRDRAGRTVGVLGTYEDITERKEAESRLRESEARFRTLIDLTYDWYWEQDAEFRFTRVESRGSSPYGLGRPGFLLGRKRWELEFDNLSEAEWEAHRALLLRHEPFRGFIGIRHNPDGSVKNAMEASGEPMFDSGGQFTGYRGVGRDITETVRMQEALRRADERMVRAFQASPEPIAIIGLEDGIVQSVNPKCEQLMGIAAADFVGKKVGDTDVVLKDQRAQFVAELRQHGVVRGRDLTVRCGDGSVMECEVSGALVESGGEPTVVAIFRDVSEERRSRREREALIEELGRKERRFRLLTTILPAGVILTDPEGECGFANDSLCEIVGVPMQALLGEGWLRFFQTSDIERLRTALRRAGESGEAAHLGAQVRRADGATRDVIVGLTPQRDDAQGRLVGFVAAVTDISEQVSAERRARELNADLEARITERTQQLQDALGELESFSYTVAHDLRAPLRSVNGFGLMLAEDCSAVLSPEGRDYLQRMVSASNRLSLMIDGLLDMSRLARKELRRSRTDLSALATDVLERLSKAEPERRVRWVVQAGLEAQCDPTLIAVALENLIANAWKYTGRAAQAEIVVGARESVVGERAVFVRDNGVGFDMSYAGKLFGVFQRLHSEAEFPGTGIGLSTARRVIERHRGRIWAESRPGEGATFYFTVGRDPLPD